MPNPQTDDVLDAVRHLIRAARDRRKLTSALSEYILVTSSLPVTHLAFWERIVRDELSLVSFSDRRHLLKWWAFGGDRPLLPWLDCCHYNGYQREKAVRALGGGAPNGFLCAMVLRRLNDWVPQVRAAAREHIPQMAEDTKPEHILEALWGILPHLKTWGRLQADDLEVLLNLLAVEGVPSKLTSKLIEITAGPAASVLEQAGRMPILDLFLPTISEEAIQPAVRAKSYRSQLAERMVWVEGRKWIWTDQRWGLGRYEPILGERNICVQHPFLETLEKAARDKSPLVRRVAGDALIANRHRVGIAAIPIAERLLGDSYPSIVERGKFVLERINS